MRRRKSGGSWKSDVEQDNSLEVEPRHKLFTSTPSVTAEQISRKKGMMTKKKFNSECYTDEEFANILSNIVDDNDEEDSSSELVIHSESTGSKNLASTSTLSSSNSKATDDCEVIDLDDLPNPPVVICERSSKIEQQRPKKTLKTDLSLNVLENSFDVHEYIRDFNNQSNSESLNPEIGKAHLENDPEIGWNDEMRHFYDQSWGGENFYIGEVLNAMPRKYIFSLLFNKFI